MILNTSKINLWVVGITMVFAGSLLVYLEDYRNSQLIYIVIYLLLFLGWVILFMQLTKGTIIDANKIPFKENKIKSLQQGTAKFFAYTVLVAIIFADFLYMSHLANERKQQILQNDPTKTAIAEINDIETSHGRSGTHYYAIFLYKTVDGQLIRHSRSESEGDFIEGQKYEIKYAVEYPEMFRIMRQVQ